MADLVGLVFFLLFGTTKLASRVSRTFLMISSLFLCWLRVSSQCIKRTLSLLNLEDNFLRSRFFSRSVKAMELSRSKVSSTLEDTLFTCCPPAPLLRTALNFSSCMMPSLFNGLLRFKTLAYGFQGNI